MNEQEIQQLISDTVATTLAQLQTMGMLRDSKRSAYEKTEELLRQYPRLKGQHGTYAQRVVQEVEACLAEASNEPYVDVISLYYFAGNKNATCADIMCCDERTCRRYRKKLVQQFSVRLASDEFIRELLT